VFVEVRSAREESATGVLQLKYFRSGRSVEKDAGGERQKGSIWWSSAAHAFADKMYL
jgi:hypothetical protein